MTDPGWALQVALIARLREVLNQAPAVPIFAAVPEGTAYPYVTFAGRATTEFDSVSKNKDEVFVYLTIWSDYAGEKEVLQIQGRIVDALHNNHRLPMSTGRMVLCRVTRKGTTPEPDGLTYQGSVTVRCVVEH